MELPGLLDLVFTGLAVVISAVAVVISAVSLRRSRNTSEKQIELEQQQAKLAQKQLEQIEAAEQKAKRANIDVELSNCLRIWNFGESEALDVDIEWIGEQPVTESEQKKLPIKRLMPGKYVELWTSFSKGSGNEFDGRVSWTNPSGERDGREFTVHR